MKTARTINLGGEFLHIDDDAYTKLQGYFADLEKYFASYDDKQEILEGIEQRFAELCVAKLKNMKVLNTQIVDEVIKQIGTARDLQSVENGTEPVEDTRKGVIEQLQSISSRRLYRDFANGYFGGVFEGIGNYFALNANIFRFFYLLILLIGLNNGFLTFLMVVALYFFLWSIIPQANKITENVMAHDGEINVAKIDEYLADKIDITTNPLRYAINRIFILVRELVMMMQKLIGALMFVLGSFIGLIVVMITFFMIFIANETNTDSVFFSYQPEVMLFVVFFCFAVTGVGSTIFLLLNGVSAMINKRLVTPIFNMLLIFILILTTVIGVISHFSALNGAELGKSFEIHSEQEATSKSVRINVSEFAEWQDYMVVFQRGAKESVEYVAHRRSNVSFGVSKVGEQLVIDILPGENRESEICFFCQSYQTPNIILITSPLINDIGVDIKGYHLADLVVVDYSNTDMNIDAKSSIRNLTVLGEYTSLNINGNFASDINITGGDSFSLLDVFGVRHLISTNGSNRTVINKLVINSTQSQLFIYADAQSEVLAVDAKLKNNADVSIHSDNADSLGTQVKADLRDNAILSVRGNVSNLELAAQDNAGLALYAITEQPPQINGIVNLTGQSKLTLRANDAYGDWSMSPLDAKLSGNVGASAQLILFRGQGELITDGLVFENKRSLVDCANRDENNTIYDNICLIDQI